MQMIALCLRPPVRGALGRGWIELAGAKNPIRAPDRLALALALALRNDKEALGSRRAGHEAVGGTNESRQAALARSVANWGPDSMPKRALFIPATNSPKSG